MTVRPGRVPGRPGQPPVTIVAGAHPDASDVIEYAVTREVSGIAPRPEVSPMPDLRVLCLHGYHGTGAILRRQMAPLACALPADIEFVYIDAPSLASGDFGWGHEGFSGWEHTRDWITGVLSAGPRIDRLF